VHYYCIGLSPFIFVQLKWSIFYYLIKWDQSSLIDFSCYVTIIFPSKYSTCDLKYYLLKLTVNIYLSLLLLLFHFLFLRIQNSNNGQIYYMSSKQSFRADIDLNVSVSAKTGKQLLKKSAILVSPFNASLNCGN
jgi:hypothetical protein